MLCFEILCRTLLLAGLTLARPGPDDDYWNDWASAGPDYYGGHDSQSAEDWTTGGYDESGEDHTEVFDPFPWENFAGADEGKQDDTWSSETKCDEVVDQAMAMINDFLTEYGAGILPRPDVDTADMTLRRGVEIGRNSGFRAGPANLTLGDGSATFRLAAGFHLYAWAYADIRSGRRLSRDPPCSGIYYFHQLEIHLALTALENRQRFGPQFSDVVLEELCLELKGGVTLNSSDPGQSGPVPQRFSEFVLRQANEEFQELKHVIEWKLYQVLNSYEPFNWKNPLHMAHLIAVI